MMVTEDPRRTCNIANMLFGTTKDGREMVIVVGETRLRQTSARGSGTRPLSINFFPSNISRILPQP